MSSFATFLVGVVLLICGLSVGAHLLDVPATWIGVSALVLLGVGFVAATLRTKARDRAA
jgi:hypothetical protein